MLTVVVNGNPDITLPLESQATDYISLSKSVTNPPTPSTPSLPSLILNTVSLSTRVSPLVSRNVTFLFIEVTDKF
jgi:hypothetical protein